ncbi:MAG: ParB N-terminal domain-containing protein, partial [Lewinella sp.]|nr:ParB N-terminal domain-containing protein [Lewinella sp.]
MTTSNIALSQLTKSEHNVRVVAPDKAAHQRLMASIASQGILQNLVVVPRDDDGADAHFEVIAGGRRLKALQALARQAAIPGDYPVPCLIMTDPAAITEISLAENVQHEAMHPADEFVAFARLVEQGQGLEDVAARFGVARSVVEKRLKLGRVAPRLLNEYRQGNLNLEAIMAFTVTDDHKRQLACYKDLSGGQFYPRAIKHWLLGEAVDAGCGIGAFVGKAAYVKAGGAVAGDLFEATVYLSDTELVCKLAQAKLDRAVKKIEKTGDWLWVESSLDRYATTEGLVQLSPALVDVPEAVSADIEALGKQIMAWEDTYYDDALPEGFADAAVFETAWDDAQRKLDALEEERDARYLQFGGEQKAYSGCVVTFDRVGKLEVIEGLARRKDIPKTTAQETKTAEAGRDAPQVKDLSQSLQDDIGQYRQQITQAALLRQPAAAIDVLHYSLCMQLLGEQGWQGRSLQSAHYQPVVSRTTRADTEQGRPFEEIEAFRETLSLEWLGIEDGGQRFSAFRALPRRTKEKLVTFCTAMSLTIGQRGSAPEQDTLIEQLGVDFAAYWRPAKDNYFGRLTIDQLKSQFGPVLGQAWVDWQDGAKKATIVEDLQDRFSEAG